MEENPIVETASERGKKHEEAIRRRTIALARIICADRIGALTDPEGRNLPDDLWKQALVTASLLMALIGRLK